MNVAFTLTIGCRLEGVGMRTVCTVVKGVAEAGTSGARTGGVSRGVSVTTGGTMLDWAVLVTGSTSGVERVVVMVCTGGAGGGGGLEGGIDCTGGMAECAGMLE